MESVYARTTSCRKCGAHYDVPKTVAPDVPEKSAGPSFFGKIQKLLKRETFRTIRCFECHATQDVSSLAKSGTCATCNCYLDLSDFKITGSYSRNIHTHGSVLIGPKGDVTSSRIACGGAVIFGKLHGSLICTGTVRLKIKGRLTGSIDAQNLVIEKGSNTECLRAIKAHSVEICGKISARIMSNAVTIAKNGSMEGTVYAKSIGVEKGGIFHGELFIGKQEFEQPDLLPVPKAKRSKARPETEGGQPALALG